MRLPAFPVPYEGETLSSVVARYLSRTPGPTQRKLDFLGMRGAASTALMPLDLQALTSAMPLGHPWSDAPDIVLTRHTLVPLYLHFAYPVRAARAKQSLLGGLCSNPAAALGVTVSAAGNISRRAKFCSECIKADLATRGNAISYLEHQPQFVKLCARHGTPLSFSCSTCFGDRNAARMWRTAGTCNCDSPRCPPVIELGHDAFAEDGWLWLSRQVRSILSAPEVPLFPQLPAMRQSLRDRGLWAGARTDNSNILHALESRFGRGLLIEAGILGTPGRTPSQQWPSRLLGEDKSVRNRIPDVLRTLLLAGLVVSDVADLMGVEVKLDSVAAAVPQGYGGNTRLGRAVLSRESVQQALASAEGNLTAAANLLRTRPEMLAVDMRRLGIRLPLPLATIRRLGTAKVEAVRAALRSGEPKHSIRSRLGVSSWTVQLVESDDQELSLLHRKAAIEAQRSKHRMAVMAYRERHPNAGKMNVLDACASAADWLRRFDRAWLAAVFPTRQAAQRPKGMPLKSWGELDQAFARQVCAVAKFELAQSNRPTRLTKTLLLKRAGANVARNAPGQYRLPLTLAAACAHAESDDSFYRRKLSWALNEYRALGVPISTNLLRRVSGLAPAILKKHRDFIVAQASRLGLSIHARCFLSPLGLPTRPVALKAEAAGS